MFFGIFGYAELGMACLLLVTDESGTYERSNAATAKDMWHNAFDRVCAGTTSAFDSRSAFQLPSRTRCS